MLYDPGTMIFQFCLVVSILYMAFLSGAMLICALIEKWRARRKRIADSKLFLLAGHRVK